MSNQVKRVAVFGGMFNPVHIGHMNSIKTVQKQMKFDRILVIPAHQSPNRPPTEGPSPAHRLEMAKQAFLGSALPVEVNSYEIDNGEISYTIKTLRHLLMTESPVELWLIIGVDQFDHFSQWKDYRAILESCSLVVTSRPDGSLPESIEHVNPELAPLIEEFSKNKIKLKSGREIHFCQLDDIEISSTEIRKKLFAQKDCSEVIPKTVLDYIQEKNLYRGITKKIDNFLEFTIFCKSVVEARKGINIKAYDLSQLNQAAEYCLIASGSSTKQTSQLAQSLTAEVKDRFGVYPQSVEGSREGRWVAIDYGQLIVHLFYDFTRQEYRLEDLWSKAKILQ